MQRRDNGIESNTESARLVHRMAGSAGMVGFAEISEAAGKLDDAIQDGDGNTRNLLCDLLAILGKTLAAQPTH